MVRYCFSSGTTSRFKSSTYFLRLLFFLEKTVHVTCEMNDNSACDEFSVNDYYARNKVMSVMYLFFAAEIVPILKMYFCIHVLSLIFKLLLNYNADIFLSFNSSLPYSVCVVCVKTLMCILNVMGYDRL